MTSFPSWKVLSQPQLGLWLWSSERIRRIETFHLQTGMNLSEKGGGDGIKKI